MEFEVQGPFEINFEKRKGGRALIFSDFWEEGNGAIASLAGKKGCYVFAIRNSGIKPIYVGKATKTFEQEVFNSSNKYKYQNGFSHCGKGTPVMFFIVPNGRAKDETISAVENFLIQAAVLVNPYFQNVKGPRSLIGV